METLSANKRARMGSAQLAPQLGHPVIGGQPPAPPPGLYGWPDPSLLHAQQQPASSSMYGQPVMASPEAQAAAAVAAAAAAHHHHQQQQFERQQQQPPHFSQAQYAHGLPSHMAMGTPSYPPGHAPGQGVSGPPPTAALLHSQQAALPLPPEEPEHAPRAREDGAAGGGGSGGGGVTRGRGGGARGQGAGGSELESLEGVIEGAKKTEWIKVRAAGHRRRGGAILLIYASLTALYTSSNGLRITAGKCMPLQGASFRTHTSCAHAGHVLACWCIGVYRTGPGRPVPMRACMDGWMDGHTFMF